MFRSDAAEPSNLVGHAGGAITLTPLVPAPREIGAVRSCSIDVGKEGPSDVRRASVGRARRGRIWFALIGGVGGYPFATIGLGRPLATAVAAAAAVLCYAATGWLVRGAQTTYVGERGVARYRGGAMDLLRFEEVKALRVGRERTQNSVLFAYSFERAGAPTFRIVGSHALTANDEPDVYGDHPLWFARAAEQAYVSFRLPGERATLANGGSIRFEVTKREAITLSPEGIELEPARGGVYRSPWRFAALPRVNGEMIELLAPKSAPKHGVSANPFAAPETDAEQVVVIFRGSELPNYALMVALMEIKIREARGAAVAIAAGKPSP